MRLLTGPAGSGKTRYVLDQLRGALRAGNQAVRLLVPTATLARHLQNQIAREGFVFRGGLIQTLSAFVNQWAADLPEASKAVFYLIVEQAARQAGRAEFARVVSMPGFCAALARSIEEFSSAGCDSARLAACLPDAPLSAAFLAVYQEVDRQLACRGLALRARRLERAAERITREGMRGIATVFLDGFHALPDPELHVIAALGRHAEVVLTLSDGDLNESARARLFAVGFDETRTAHLQPWPVKVLTVAPGIERETEEIARRILEQAAAGRPFREIGIIVRATASYVPVLRATLERFGIPAHFYFDSELRQHAAIRFLSGAVDAVLGGWEHSQTLAVLRLAPRFADSGGLDRVDFAVREQLPSSGLGALRKLAAECKAPKLVPLIDELAALEEWQGFALTPKDWAARFRTLRKLYRPAVRELPYADGHEMALLLRSQAAALDLFEQACDEAAQALDAQREMGMEPFWRTLESVLRLKPLRLDDRRRNVVHVLSAPEARQWVLPVVFVCGMVEKQFPCMHNQDPFLPDDARRKLNASGVRVRTAAEFEREERALFDSAVTRATEQVTLSYPEFDGRGDRHLPSLYLAELKLEPQESRAARPQRGAEHSPFRRPGTIRSPALHEALRQKTARLSPTQLESFSQCPFQYFGRYTLRLGPAPPRPEDRLDFLTQGTIIHEVLKAWWAERQDIGALFETVFARYVEERHIPRCYHTQRVRNAMLDDLRSFASSDTWPRAEWESRLEQDFAFAMDASLEITGKIDRLDEAADGSAYVIDYKYSAPQRTEERVKDESLLQAPLYLMAAERRYGVRPAGMFYIGLKSKIVYAGWSNSALMGKPPLPEGFLERARERTLELARQIREGHVTPAPRNPDHCRFCDLRDACRIEVRSGATPATNNDGLRHRTEGA